MIVLDLIESPVSLFQSLINDLEFGKELIESITGLLVI
jgi:hypothetical protein